MKEFAPMQGLKTTMKDSAREKNVDEVIQRTLKVLLLTNSPSTSPTTPDITALRRRSTRHTQDPSPPQHTTYIFNFNLRSTNG